MDDILIRLYASIDKPCNILGEDIDKEDELTIQLKQVLNEYDRIKLEQLIELLYKNNNISSQSSYIKGFHDCFELLRCMYR
ncbi:MAG: hypothetical protein AB9856_20975 [Cellulosilyticaceae bacterium]